MKAVSPRSDTKLGCVDKKTLEHLNMLKRFIAVGRRGPLCVQISKTMRALPIIRMQAKCSPNEVNLL